jgi:hypothetical protein
MTPMQDVLYVEIVNKSFTNVHPLRPGIGVARNSMRRHYGCKLLKTDDNNRILYSSHFNAFPFHGNCRPIASDELKPQ